ncbi:MAG: alpha-glucosidase [Terracidiphilus sp.]|nr:alpha-glucosidase [Terracidiphilus sp.]
MNFRRVTAGAATCTLILAFAAGQATAQMRIAKPSPKAHTAAPVPAQASEREWWKNAVIYEIYPRSFQDSNGDGIGDLNGITRRLDYLKQLGVDAIWLTPVYPSPQVDFGYDISDYENIDPQYGTLADFDRLIAEANRRHIRVVMDMVMNHTSDKHTWFEQSRSSKTNPYRDWYVWRDAKGYDAAGKPIAPNNWQSLFGHSAWEWDEGTKQFYYHKFYTQQPDVNWNNAKIHAAFKDVLAFWLKRGVAGFRFDAITTLYEDPAMADEGVVKDKNGDPVINAYGDPQLDNSKTDNLPGLHPVMQEMRAASGKFGSSGFPGTRLLIGETYVPTIQDLARMYGPAGKPEFHLPMDTQVAIINKLDVATFRAKLNDVETKIGSNVPLLLFDNHDNPRMDLRYGDGVHDTEIQRALAAVLLASRGAALMYYGDEIGMKTTPPERKEDVKDPIGVTGWPKEKGRDGERTPMQWDASAEAGFTTATPWLPVPPTAATINVRAEQSDRDSLLAWYKSLIRLKKSNAALSRGTNQMLDTLNTDVLSWVRTAPGAAPVVVAVNFTAQPQTVNLSAATDKTAQPFTLLKSPGGNDPDTLGKIELEPFGVYIGEIR